ncbi:MAG: voltage-gated sodium channel [Thermoleophilaceae bacterium]|nr:voltage-gated sodium channel [Thermoleophilaceae bacterium]
MFTVELAIRLLAYAPNFREFFRSGWNVFDFVVIAASFVPFLGDSATILRLVRLARIVRVVSLFPDLRILLVAVGRSIPPILSMMVMATLMIYVYAIVGWILFAQAIPARWGDVGTAMLNLFVMLTLENFPDNLAEGMAVHPWSWIYFVSFALIASFLLLNVLIGIVINSMDEARTLEHEREREERRALILAADGDHEIDPDEGLKMIAEKLESVRDALSELEDEIALVKGSTP